MYTKIPAIRHGTNEQKALKELNNELKGNQPNAQIHVSRIKPLIEIIEQDDLNNITHYTTRYDEVFLEFPRYLLDRDNKHQSEVANLVSNYSNDPTAFHTRNSKLDTTPVISGSIDPIDHTNYVQYIQTLAQKFDRLCVRIFAPTKDYTQAEKQTIQQIIDELRPEDAILMDVLDVAKLSSGIRPNLEYIASEAENQDMYVFDLFEPRDGVNYNYGLVTAKYLDADGTGDFVLEPRLPQNIPDAAFQNIPRRIRQYDAGHHSVSTWEDSDRYVNAVQEMIRNGNLNQNHCHFCQQLYNEYQTVTSSQSRKDLGAGFVKRMRMNHYLYSILSEEYPGMTSAPSAKDFDQSGHADLF